MAKVIITFDDATDGTSNVSIVCTPSCLDMVQATNAGHKLTPAQGYALRAMRACHDESRKNNPNKILLPSLVGRS